MSAMSDEGVVKFKKRSGTKKASMRVKKDFTEEEDDTATRTALEQAKSSVSDSVKQRGTVVSSSANSNKRSKEVTTVYESKREVVPHVFAGSDATASFEIDTAHDRDRTAVLERSGKSTDQLNASKMGGTFGPMRAPTFLRSTSRFDYCPDICKDYKETGFCGYGDNCKFLHDRGDYKSGWQMEREWEEQQAAKKRRLQQAVDSMEHEDADREESDEDNFEIPDEEEFPFACYICREPFTDPVVTLCGHYFCQSCAMQKVKNSNSSTAGRCAVCDKQTFGVFNKARKLIRYMNSIDKSSKSNTIGGSNVTNDSANKTAKLVHRTKSKGSWEVLN